MPVTPADLAAIQGHVSTIQTTKSALTDVLATLAPQFAEGEMRALGSAPVQVLVKRDGAMKLENLASLVDQA